jgi:hypothetical protein
MLHHKDCLSLVQVTQCCEVPDLIRPIWPGYFQKSIASYWSLIILVNLRSLTNRVELICSKFTQKINITLRTGEIRWGEGRSLERSLWLRKIGVPNKLVVPFTFFKCDVQWTDYLNKQVNKQLHRAESFLTKQWSFSYSIISGFSGHGNPFIAFTRHCFWSVS